MATADMGLYDPTDPNNNTGIAPPTPGVTPQPATAATTAPYSGGAGPIASSQGQNSIYGPLSQALYARATSPLYASPDDPNVKAATDAYGADITRQGRNFLSQNAAGAAGAASNTDAATRSTAEKAGQATADYRANLVNQLSALYSGNANAATGALGTALSNEDAVRLQQENQDLARSNAGAAAAQQTFENNYKTIFG